MSSHSWMFNTMYAILHGEHRAVWHENLEDLRLRHRGQIAAVKIKVHLTTWRPPDDYLPIVVHSKYHWQQYGKIHQQNLRNHKITHMTETVTHPSSLSINDIAKGHAMLRPMAQHDRISDCICIPLHHKGHFLFHDFCW